MEIVKAVVSILEAVFPTFFSLNPSQQLCQSYYPHFTVGKTELVGRNSWIQLQSPSSTSTSTASQDEIIPLPPTSGKTGRDDDRGVFLCPHVDASRKAKGSASGNGLP